MSDIRDFTGKNRKFTGTTGIKIPSGTQAERLDEAGQLRFNTDTNLAEYYDGTDWVIVNILPSGGSNTTTDPDNYSCTLYKKAGTAFTDAGTMRICNVVGGLELYVRVSNTGDPNTDWAFQHLL